MTRPAESHPPHRGVLWLRATSARAVVAAHLRHLRGAFRAAGWRVVVGEEPPATVEGAVAVVADPWVEALPAVAEALAGAAVDGARWRVPRVNGVPPPQGWQVTTGPYTLRDYERVAVTRGRGRGVPAGPEPWCGLAVAATGDVGALLDDLEGGWPPAPAAVALVPGGRLFRYDDPAGHDRRELDPFLPQEAATVVDVGCGHGRFGARHRRPGRRVIGIEPDRELAREAARRLDLVLPTPAEEGLAALAPGVDCLVFADVLEHTDDPAAVLERAAAAVAEDGRIVVSLPNTAWAPVLRALAAGRWDPTLAGVQARDHLAPFTPRSFARLAAEHGLEVVDTTPLRPPLPLRLRLWARLAAVTAGGSHRDLLTAQWIAVLRRRVV